MQLHKLNIALNKIEGTKTFTAKNGEVFIALPVKASNAFLSDRGGIYLNVDMIANKTGGEDQYGNTHMLTLDIGADRRGAGEKGVILGNAKTLIFGESKPAVKVATPAHMSDALDTDDDFIPF